jgi:hypothetical protein
MRLLEMRKEGFFMSMRIEYGFAGPVWGIFLRITRCENTSATREER